MTGVALISIVDDDGAFRASLDNLIRSAGLRTQGFPSAEAFLISERRNDTTCLILDVRLPGMTGLQLQSTITAGGHRVPIVFVTSHVDNQARTRALDAGAVAFLYKPCREDDLLGAIRLALQKELN